MVHYNILYCNITHILGTTSRRVVGAGDYCGEVAGQMDLRVDHQVIYS